MSDTADTHSELIAALDEMKERNNISDADDPVAKWADEKKQLVDNIGALTNENNALREQIQKWSAACAELSVQVNTLIKAMGKVMV